MLLNQARWRSSLHVVAGRKATYRFLRKHGVWFFLRDQILDEYTTSAPSTGHRTYTLQVGRVENWWQLSIIEFACDGRKLLGKNRAMAEVARNHKKADYYSAVRRIELCWRSRYRKVGKSKRLVTLECQMYLSSE
jgi:hypothetical protein